MGACYVYMGLSWGASRLLKAPRERKRKKGKPVPFSVLLLPRTGPPACKRRMWHSPALYVVKQGRRGLPPGASADHNVYCEGTAPATRGEEVKRRILTHQKNRYDKHMFSIVSTT